uniref:Uncharacterized protein n=1 Tax=Callorhinchus milii TaxID=7868 RepID=A0A4W3HLP9_CALMI
DSSSLFPNLLQYKCTQGSLNIFTDSVSACTVVSWSVSVYLSDIESVSHTLTIKVPKLFGMLLFGGLSARIPAERNSLLFLNSATGSLTST